VQSFIDRENQYEAQMNRQGLNPTYSADTIAYLPLLDIPVENSRREGTIGRTLALGCDVKGFFARKAYDFVERDTESVSSPGRR
jgi:hypothetical protein